MARGKEDELARDVDRARHGEQPVSRYWQDQHGTPNHKAMQIAIRYFVTRDPAEVTDWLLRQHRGLHGDEALGYYECFYVSSVLLGLEVALTTGHAEVARLAHRHLRNIFALWRRFVVDRPRSSWELQPGRKRRDPRVGVLAPGHRCPDPWQAYRDEIAEGFELGRWPGLDRDVQPWRLAVYHVELSRARGQVTDSDWGEHHFDARLEDPITIVEYEHGRAAWMERGRAYNNMIDAVTVDGSDCYAATYEPAPQSVFTGRRRKAKIEVGDQSIACTRKIQTDKHGRPKGETKLVTAVIPLPVGREIRREAIGT